MQLKFALLASAAAAAFLATAGAANLAMADPIPRAASYADLLEPVPDAAARLQADDALRAQAAHIERVEYRYGGWDHHHHHHHHHHHSWQWYQARGYYWNGWAWALRPRAHHHHHHSWQWYQDRGYYRDGRVWRPPSYHHHHHHQSW